MSVGPADVLIAATGPARLGDELARGTRPVTSLAVRARLAYAAITRMPEGLAGLEILDLVGRRVQAPQARVVPSPRPVRSARERVLPSGNGDRRLDRTWSDAASERAMGGASAANPAQSTRPPERASAGAPVSPLVEPAVRPEASPAVDSGQAPGDGEWSPAGGANGEGGRAWPAADAPGTPPARRVDDLRTPLAGAVGRYWAAQPAPSWIGGNSPRSSAAPAPTGPPTGARSAALGGPAAIDPAVRRWPATLTTALASGPAWAATAPVSTLPLLDGEGTDPESVEIRNVFNIGFGQGPGGAVGSDELAEQIAVILRDQALRHGIDLT